MSQVPTEGFLPEEGVEVDSAPLTVAVSCLMSYEHTGGPLAHSKARPLIDLALFDMSDLSPCPGTEPRLGG